MEYPHVTAISAKYKTVVSNKNITILYYREHKLIQYIWNQCARQEDYRKSIMAGLDFAQENPVELFLTDIRKQGVVSPTDRKWFESEALPLGIEVGLKRIGMVMEGNVFKKYYYNILLRHSTSYGLSMKFFSSTEEAMEWLLRK